MEISRDKRNIPWRPDSIPRQARRRRRAQHRCVWFSESEHARRNGISGRFVWEESWSGWTWRRLSIGVIYATLDETCAPEQTNIHESVSSWGISHLFHGRKGNPYIFWFCTIRLKAFLKCGVFLVVCAPSELVALGKTMNPNLILFAFQKIYNHWNRGQRMKGGDGNIFDDVHNFTTVKDLRTDTWTEPK